MIQNRRIRNIRGVTLVEVMIALVIMLVVFMGLIQASLLSINHNLRNELRDEAVKVASDRVAAIRAMSFPAVQALSGDDNPGVAVNRNIRNISNFPFTVRTRLLNRTAFTQEVWVQVLYTPPGDAAANTYDFRTLVRNK